MSDSTDWLPGSSAPDHAAFLTALRDRLRSESDTDVILAETSERLGRHLGVNRTGYGEFDEHCTLFIPRNHWIDGSVISIDETLPFSSFGAAITQSHKRGEIWIHESLDDPKLDDEGRAMCRALGIQSVITVPLIKNGRLVSLLSAQQNEPRHWTKGEIALVAELAERTWATLERARAEAELERSREALVQSEKMTALGSLLAGVSHELNNPLSIIVAQAELLEIEADGTPAADRAGKIRRAAERSARIVQTFLAMARQKSPNRAAVNLNDIVIAALDLTSYGLRSSGVTVRRALAPDLPTLMADPDQLHQVVVNLIVNAQQAMEQQSGSRELTLTTAAGWRGHVVLEVMDTGPGIPGGLRHRIFEPFFTTKPQDVGTGVGLSFSQGIVEAHQGRLEAIESRHGALFRMTLPIGDGALDGGPVEDLAEAPAAGQPHRTALVIDDEPEIAGALADILALEGFECTTAHDGVAAKAMLRNTAYDLIVSDLRMPDMDGPTLFVWLRELRPDLVPAFAFSTGDTLSAAAARFLRESGRPFMEKPFTRAAVRRLTEAVVAARPASA